LFCVSIESFRECGQIKELNRQDTETAKKIEMDMLVIRDLHVIHYRFSRRPWRLGG
jgi:hypothetical protein